VVTTYFYESVPAEDRFAQETPRRSGKKRSGRAARAKMAGRKWADRTGIQPARRLDKGDAAIKVCAMLADVQNSPKDEAASHGPHFHEAGINFLLSPGQIRSLEAVHFDSKKNPGILLGRGLPPFAAGGYRTAAKYVVTTVAVLPE